MYGTCSGVYGPAFFDPTMVAMTTQGSGCSRHPTLLFYGIVQDCAGH